jgi:Domain of unknown function (DUF4234)
MSDPTMPPPDPNVEPASPQPGPPPAYGAVPATPEPAAVVQAPIGKIRNTGTCVLLTIVTLGIYTLVWYFKTHEEMRRHTGTGLGAGIALVLAIFVGIVMPFLTSNEVGDLYKRRGQQPPVSVLTGLWALLLGWFFFVGLIVWFVKTNGALNDYWRSVGAR